jgi:hypothetical protein
MRQPPGGTLGEEVNEVLDLRELVWRQALHLVDECGGIRNPLPIHQ